MATLTNPHDDLFAGLCIQTAIITIALSQWRSYGVVPRLSQAYVFNFSKVHPLKTGDKDMHIESADMIIYWRYNQYTITERVCDLRDIFFLRSTNTHSILHCSQLYPTKSQLIFLVWLFLSRAGKLSLKERAVCKPRVIPNKLVACHM